MPKQKLVVLNKPPLLVGNDVEQKRTELREYFEQSWELYGSLFALINEHSAYFLRPEPLRHPLIFYYGHTAVFYVNKLLLGNFMQDRVDLHIESSCAIGVDEMSWDDLSADNYQWPSVQAVADYRDKVKAKVLQLIDTMPISLPISQDSLAWVILMGCEHERIHIETSSVIMRMLDLDYLSPTEQWAGCQQAGTAPDNQLLEVHGQELVLGRATTEDTYGWDNEYGHQPISVESFSASEFLVSNQEYLGFVQAQGYQTPEYWSEEGQAWLAFTKASKPRFWLCKQGKYWQRNLTQEQPLPLNWPVEVNYLEAKAFCNWKNGQSDKFVRLPTEAEWQVMRNALPTDVNDWQSAPGNINLEHFASSCPVDSFKQTEFYDLIGNVWQWTESPIDGYEGFKVHALYDDFSTPTFDGKHNLIKGGSWISTGNEATRQARYAFRRHFHQHLGFRYVASDSLEIPIKPVILCEMQTDISCMLHHQYAAHSQQPTHDIQQLLALLSPYLQHSHKALDLGCGTGRLSFELSKSIAHVQGIDATARHVQHCLALRDSGYLRYAMPTEGQLHEFFEVSVAALKLQPGHNGLHFSQGDGHNLKAQFSDYDLVICYRLLEFCYNPRQMLEQVCARVQPKGILVLGSNYAWDSQLAKPQDWIGGVKRNGENLSSESHLKELLSPQFELLSQTNISSHIQQDSRSSLTSHNHLTFWQKK